jgi:DUF1016 N-terminal domain
LIGAHLVEFEQSGEDRARYGEQLLSNLAADLKAKGLKGLGVSMPKNCRQFYRTYPQIRQSVIGGESDQGLAVLPPENLLPLSWTHFIELIRIDDPLKRTLYEIECFRGNWSVRQLQRQIGSLLYERTGLSMDKEAVPPGSHAGLVLLNRHAPAGSVCTRIRWARRTAIVQRGGP